MDQIRSLHCTDRRLIEWAHWYFTIRNFQGFDLDPKMPFLNAVDHKGELTIKWTKEPDFSMIFCAEQAWVTCGELAQNVVHQVMEVDK